MRTKNLAIAILAVLASTTLILASTYLVREYKKIAMDHAEDEAWNQQAEIDSAKWVRSPAGKRSLAEKAREKRLYEQATATVLKRHGLTNLSNNLTPPDMRLMDEITEETMRLLQRKEE